MTVALEDRIADLEQRQSRFKLATTGMEGWENYFQTLIMQERDFFLDVMAETIAQLQRQVITETKAAIETALARRIRGTHDPKAEYCANDLVAKDGASFVAKRNNPGALPGDGWQLLCRQGKPGSAGERGAPGRDAPRIVSWKVDRQHYLVIPVMSDGREGPALELRALFEQTT